MSKKGIFLGVDDQGEHHEQKKEFAYICSPEPRSIAHRLDGSCRLYGQWIENTRSNTGTNSIFIRCCNFSNPCSGINHRSHGNSRSRGLNRTEANYQDQRFNNSPANYPESR
jgi:hypothetical protein